MSLDQVFSIPAQPDTGDGGEHKKHLQMPTSKELRRMIARVTALAKQLVGTLKPSERYEFEAHHELSSFLGSAATIHRASSKGLVAAERHGNVRVGAVLDPHDEEKIRKILEHAAVGGKGRHLMSRLRVSVPVQHSWFSILRVGSACFVMNSPSPHHKQSLFLELCRASFGQRAGDTCSA